MGREVTNPKYWIREVQIKHSLRSKLDNTLHVQYRDIVTGIDWLFGSPC